LLIGVVCLGISTSAWAQRPKPKTGGSKVTGKTAPPAPKSKVATDLPPLDTEKLPAGYVPPREVPEQMKIDKPLPVPDLRSADFKKQNTAYQALLTKGTVKTDADKKLLRWGISIKLARMTLKENRDQLPKIRAEIVRDLGRTCGPLVPALELHDQFLAILCEEVDKLLDNHFVVRLNAMILLTEINWRDENHGQGQKEVACVLGEPPLTKVLSDPQQLEPVKIWAVKGLARIAAESTARADTRQRVVKALLTELASSKKHEWLQLRLVEAVGASGVVEVEKRPQVVQDLAKVMVDPDRHWMVRSEAAYQIARLPLDSVRELKVNLLAVEMVRLGEQMAIAYEKNSKEFYWKDCFFKLYLAFTPLNGDEKSKKYGLREQVTQNPSLSSYKDIVQQSYEKLLPLVQKVLGGKVDVKISDQLKSIKEWLGNNQPKDLRIVPNEEPIITTQPRDKPNPQAG
jgi:hypothetical protein